MRLLTALIATLVTTACASQQSPICTALYAYGITVTVLDASTSEAPQVAPMGTVRDGNFSDSMTVMGNQLVGAGERAGTYDVRVTAPGYTAWDTTGIVVTADECHVHGVSLTATLQRQT
jgi:hypothetical protein